MKYQVYKKKEKRFILTESYDTLDFALKYIYLKLSEKMEGRYIVYFDNKVVAYVNIY